MTISNGCLPAALSPVCIHIAITTVTLYGQSQSGIGTRLAAWRALNLTVLLQIIIAMSPTLHSIIVLADDPR